MANPYGYSKGLPGRIRRLASQNHAMITESTWRYHVVDACRVLRCSFIPYFDSTYEMLDPWFKRT